MSKFKIGDIVHYIGDSSLEDDIMAKWKKERTLLKIIKVDYDDTVKVVTMTYRRWFYCSDIILAVKDNPINKLLYPDYEEKDGYLVPKGEI